MSSLKYWLAFELHRSPGKERFEQFDTVRPPGPGPQTAELPLAETVGRIDAPFPEFDELRQRKPGLLEAEKARRRPFRQKHDIVRPTRIAAGWPVFGEHRLVSYRSEGFAVRDIALGKGVEYKNTGGAAFARPGRSLGREQSESPEPSSAPDVCGWNFLSRGVARRACPAGSLCFIFARQVTGCSPRLPMPAFRTASPHFVCATFPSHRNGPGFR